MKKRGNKSFRYVEYFYKNKQEIQVQVFLYLIETNKLGRYISSILYSTIVLQFSISCLTYLLQISKEKFLFSKIFFLRSTVSVQNNNNYKDMLWKFGSSRSILGVLFTSIVCIGQSYGHLAAFQGLSCRERRRAFTILFFIEKSALF